MRSLIYKSTLAICLLLLVGLLGFVVFRGSSRPPVVTESTANASGSHLLGHAHSEDRFHRLYEESRYLHPGEGVFMGPLEQTSRLLQTANALSLSPDPEHKARAHRILGQQAMREGDLQRAHQHFDAILNDSGLSDNDRFQAGMDQARLARLLGNVEQSRNILSDLRDEILQSGSQKPERQRASELAQLAIAMGEVELADEIMAGRLDPSAPENQDMGLRLAQAYRDAKCEVRGCPINA